MTVTTRNRGGWVICAKTWLVLSRRQFLVQTHNLHHPEANSKHNSTVFFTGWQILNFQFKSLMALEISEYKMKWRCFSI